MISALRGWFGELVRYSVIDVIDDQTLSIHRLVQAVLRDRLPDRERAYGALAGIKLVFKAFPRDGWDSRTWPRCERLLAHGLTAGAHAGVNGVAPDGIAHVLASAARYLRARARYDEAAELLIQGIAILKSAFDDRHFAIGMLANDLGRVYQDLGRYPDARAQYERGLELTQAEFGENHPNTAACHTNPGELFREMEEIELGLPHLSRPSRSMKLHWMPVTQTLRLASATLVWGCAFLVITREHGNSSNEPSKLILRTLEVITERLGITTTISDKS